MPGPPPPPPPMGGGLGPGGGAAPAGRGQLLGAIHKGVALKKTVTNDRSAPITGNVKPGPGGGNAGGNSGGSGRGPLRPANNNSSPSGGPPLAGLFAGGMPKLKPANQRGNAGNDAPPPPAWDAPSRGASEPPAPNHTPSNGGKRVFPGDVKNRGPPPQPPPAAFKPAMAAVETDRRKHRNASLKKELSATHIVERGIGKLTNKPAPAAGTTNRKPEPGWQPAPAAGTTNRKPEPGRLPATKISQLQGKLEGGPQPVVSVTSMKDDSRYRDGTVERTTKRLSSTFVEPKPETVVTRDNVSKIKRQLSRHGIADASSSDGRLSVGSRNSHGKPNLAPRPPSDSSPQQQQRVIRAQSMRTQRSPPVLPPSPQPPGFQSNSIQQQQHASSTSGLNQPPAPPNSMNQFRTLPSKPRPRPPTSRPPPPPSRPPPPPVHAPPPPPHRTMPAAPGFPPNMAMPANGMQRLQPGPPPTPARNSSMRGAETFERNFTWRGANEFPRPPPFLARPKVFNSVSVRMAGGGGKAQAPQPPVLQLGNKMYARDTSRC